MDWRDAKIGGQVGKGWEPLVDELHRQVTAITPDLIVDQVKEKFGGLRYYYTLPGYDDGAMPSPGIDEVREKIERLVAAAEVASCWICEACGQAGAHTDTDGGYWLKTLCDKCRQERASGKRPKGL